MRFILLGKFIIYDGKKFFKNCQNKTGDQNAFPILIRNEALLIITNKGDNY